jgi:hypothetical protein
VHRDGSQHMSEQGNEYLINLKSLGNAKFIYCSATDTLHIIMDEGDADKELLLENNVIVRIRSGRVIEIAIQEVSKIVQE